MIAAVIAVESGGDNRAVGDGGRAYGCLQIHAVYVRDVNRITKRSFRHVDAFKRPVAVWMTRQYLEHYGEVYRRRTGKPPTYEVYARMHVAGPYGWRKTCSLPYWRKVQRELRRLGAVNP